MLGSDAAARRVLLALPWLAYPLAVWAGLALGGTRLAGALVIAALALRSLLVWRRAEATRLLTPLVAAGLPAVAAFWLDDPLLLLFVPVLVSLGLLGVFAFSLWRGPPLIESVARLQVGELSPAEVRYCRGVTALWCALLPRDRRRARRRAHRARLALPPLHRRPDRRRDEAALPAEVKRGRS